MVAAPPISAPITPALISMRALTVLSPLVINLMSPPVWFEVLAKMPARPGRQRSICFRA
jgi:hypothetical protein